MPRPSRTRLVRLLAAPLLACALAACAQTLARPGWAGSGITAEPWWRSAVFYRIAPEHFQDSDGDGVGDLRGISQRLDYLQSLGVDAIVLQLPFDDTGFDDLLAEASRRHIRLVIGLDRGSRPLEDKAGQTLAAAASHWLVRGAAGILLPPPATEGATTGPEDQMRHDVAEPLLLLALRRAAAQMPGGRVVIPEASLASLLPSGTRSAGTRTVRADNPQLLLTTLPINSGQAPSPADVVAALTKPIPGDSAPLLQLRRPESNAASATPEDAQIAAAVLLTQRSAILIEYGQELGAAAPDHMPWTPSNVTPAPETPPEPAKPAPAPAPGEIVYGPYRPYVPPPPPKPKPPAPAPGTIVLPDPDSLPGFTSKSDGADPAGKARISDGTVAPSVALQERDSRSVLSLYRRLLALHHGSPAFRSGSLAVLHQGGSGNADSTVAWVRRAPAGARTAVPAVIAVNCGDTPATISLEDDFVRLHIGAGELRSLLTAGQIMGRTRLTLAPHSVFVGELVQER